jgi:arylsulfatase A-like enzyme
LQKGASSGDAGVRYVIIVSVDGLRPDAIGAANAKSLLSLMSAGARAVGARTISRSETLPAHASMITGVDTERHGVTWNSVVVGWMEQPSMFDVARGAGVSTAFLFSKEKLGYLAKPGSVDWLYGPRCPPSVMEGPGAEAVARQFAERWPRVLTRLTLIHLGDPDSAGHLHGWMGPEYLEAVRRADGAIGIILETVRRAGCEGSTAIIVTSDHGGYARGHFAPGASRADCLTVPWICVAPGIPPGTILRAEVRVYDTAPTALAFLGLALPGIIDGRPVKEVLQRTETPHY